MEQHWPNACVPFHTVRRVEMTKWSTNREKHYYSNPTQAIFFCFAWDFPKQQQSREKKLMAKHISMHMIFPPTFESASLIYRENFLRNIQPVDVLIDDDTLIVWCKIQAKRLQNAHTCHSKFTLFIRPNTTQLNGRFVFDCIPFSTCLKYIDAIFLFQQLPSELWI